MAGSHSLFEISCAAREIGGQACLPIVGRDGSVLALGEAGDPPKGLWVKYALDC